MADAAVNGSNLTNDDRPVLSARVGRAHDATRPVRLERGAVPYAEGSCLVSFGETRVLCAASVETGVPGWRRGSGDGWVTAEYSMLPRATKTRSSRERQQVGGRTQEIQRLVGRSVRAMLDDFRFGEFTVKVDCDVLQADGGTRTAAITGACVAVHDAFTWMVQTGRIPVSPVRRRVAAISIGLVDDQPRLDLDYEEDVRAGVDMNVVMSSEGRFVEVQGTLSIAVRGIETLDALQLRVLAEPFPNPR